jgi:hypothetical protein
MMMLDIVQGIKTNDDTPSSKTFWNEEYPELFHCSPF